MPPELIAVLVSIGTSLLGVWGSYKLFQGRTEEWRQSVKDNLSRLEKRLETLHKRTHRYRSWLLTHELELEQVMRKLNIPRGRRRDDEDDEELD